MNLAASNMTRLDMTSLSFTVAEADHYLRTGAMSVEQHTALTPTRRLTRNWHLVLNTAGRVIGIAHIGR